MSIGTHSSNAAQPEPYCALACQENAQQSVSRSTKTALSDLSNQSRRSSIHRVSIGTNCNNAAQPEPYRALAQLACQENAQQSVSNTSINHRSDHRRLRGSFDVFLCGFSGIGQVSQRCLRLSTN